ncbi:unnamed protein product [Rotaria sp. Silwood1]|nr:unnamed protein product [Rotaria sp. Silwood1]CAF3547698.1 unnamed protein product [Rotaria sp. Silwood1]CAF3548930.1 unnamed protein product [Rotaria sp. Silwood1]CAF3569478.1 unnamed protein product [Rotaria sp. Silwood1]
MLDYWVIHRGTNIGSISFTQEISNNELDDILVLSDDRLIVVNFIATWCNSYQDITSYMDCLSVQYSNVLFLKANIEKCSRNFSSTSSSKNYQELIARSCSITFFLVAPTSFMQLPHMGVHGGSGKANTTVLLTIGADGTCLPPYIIYKSLRLYDKWCPKNVIPGAVFNGTESGWIDENCFYDYLSKLFIPKTGHFPRPLFLIIDNHSTHLSIKTAKLAIQHEIHILCLPPRSTHMLKPLDIYTLKYVKTQWRSLLWEFNKSSRNRALDKPDFVKLFSKLYDYALLPAHCAPSFA